MDERTVVIIGSDRAAGDDPEISGIRVSSLSFVFALPFLLRRRVDVRKIDRLRVVRHSRCKYKGMDSCFLRILLPFEQGPHHSMHVVDFHRRWTTLGHGERRPQPGHDGAEILFQVHPRQLTKLKAWFIAIVVL